MGEVQGKVSTWLIVAVCALPALARIELGSPFADGLVLQRDRAVPVWGTSAPGSRVTVSFAGDESETVAGPDGRWRIALPAMPACGEGRTLSVSEREDGWFGSKLDEVEIHDVLVGEVWMASGQSNMDCPLWGKGTRYRDANGALVASMTHLPEIRYFKSPNVWKTEPSPVKVVWKTLTAEHLAEGKFSAVAFYFARELHLALRVPIGIVDASWGGTNIDAWTPRSAYEDCDPALRPTADYPVRADFDRTRDGRGPISGPMQQPTVLWNGMVAAFAPMAMRGFIWYQGCHNGNEGDLYRLKMHALYRGWSREFENPDLRIYFVQLAPWQSNWNGLCAAQSKFAAEERNAELAVTADVGNFDDIHPNRKETVAKRLAVHALKRDYGFAIEEDRSPTLRSVSFSGGRARLVFDNVRDWYVYSPDRSRAAAFQLAGADGVWKPAKVVNVVASKNRNGKTQWLGPLNGKDLVVASDEVKAPKKLRYLQSAPWFGALYNDVCLPLGAFEIK